MTDAEVLSVILHHPTASDRRDSYSGLKAEVLAAPDMFERMAVEHDVECGLLCEPH